MENEAAQKKLRFHNLRGNKGYYGLVLGDTAQASIMLSLNLMLISLPLGVLMGLVNFGVNIYAGIKTQPTPVQKKDSSLQIAAMTADGKKPDKANAVWATLKRMRRYISSTFRDPKVVVGSASAAAGTNILFQALWGIHSILTTHSLLFVGSVTGGAAAGAVAGCAVIGAIASFAIVAGTFDKWKGFSRFFTQHFRGGNAAEAPAAKKPSRFLSKHPRLQKFVHSPFAARTKDTLMILLTLESSIFVVGASTSLIARRISNIISSPRAILPGLIPLALAINWGKGPVINFIAVGRMTLGRHVKMLVNKIRKKPAAAEKPAVSKTPPQAAPEALLAPATVEAGVAFPENCALASGFNNKGAKPETENKAEPGKKPATLGSALPTHAPPAIAAPNPSPAAF